MSHRILNRLRRWFNGGHVYACPTCRDIGQVIHVDGGLRATLTCPLGHRWTVTA